MSMEKSTYLIYGIALPIRREKGEDGYWTMCLGDTGRSWADDDLLPYIEGHDGRACHLLYGETPVGKAYFGLVLASTHGRHEDIETDVTGFWVEDNGERMAQSIREMAWLLGQVPEPRLLLVDIIR